MGYRRVADFRYLWDDYCSRLNFGVSKKVESQNNFLSFWGKPRMRSANILESTELIPDKNISKHFDSISLHDNYFIFYGQSQPSNDIFFTLSGQSDVTQLSFLCEKIDLLGIPSDIDEYGRRKSINNKLMGN